MTAVERDYACWYAVVLPQSDYQTVWNMQRQLVEAKADKRVDHDVVFLLEHSPVFTLGRRGGLNYLRMPERFFEDSGIQIVQAERGGFITYHGPGQLVGYPVLDLRKNRLRIVELVEKLEELMIETAACWGVTARRDPSNRGVWVENRKLGSIGIAVRHGISYHGFALNIDLSLKPFGWIAPCGLEGVVMTTLAAEAGRTIRVEDVHEVVVDRIPCVFGVKIQKMSVGQFAQDFGMRDDLSGESFLTTAPKRV